MHIEYYTWLYRRFAGSIRQHSQRLGRSAEIYLISHILLARVMAESATNEERRRWMRLIDEKHGEKVPFIIAESNEAQYVELLGAERVASLGGRGGSCTNAMRRIASVNKIGCLAAWEAILLTSATARGGLPTILRPGAQPRYPRI